MQPGSAHTSTRAASRVPQRMAGLWLIGIGLYLAAITWIGWGDVAKSIETIDLRWIAAGMAVEAVAIWTRVLKWRIALGTDARATVQFFLAKAAGNFTPGRIGELSPLLLKRFRQPRTGAWILLDRLMEGFATLLFGVAGATFIAGASEHRTLLMWIVIVTAILGALLFLLFRTDLSKRMRAVLEPERRQGTAGLLTAFLCDAADEIRLLGAKAPTLGCMTMLVTAMDILVAYCLYSSFSHHVPFLTLAAAQCAHAIVSAIPISPNFTGIPYAVSAGLLNEVAGVPLDVLAAAIAVRFLMASVVFWTSFAAGTGNLFERRRFADQGQLFDYLASGEVLYAYSPDAMDVVRDTIGPSGLTLDIGCGDGVLAGAINGQVIGLDISRNCARAARARGIHAVVGDAKVALPFAKQCFDTVVCIDVLHHLDGAWAPVLSEVNRVVRPGGRIVIIEPDARNAFVRWTQAPKSPIRVAPWPNEPAIYPGELERPLRELGYSLSQTTVSLEAEQNKRDVFPLWQRLLKAPFVIALAMIYRGRPNKFAIVAQKDRGSST